MHTQKISINIYRLPRIQDSFSWREKKKKENSNNDKLIKCLGEFHCVSKKYKNIKKKMGIVKQLLRLHRL